MKVHIWGNSEESQALHAKIVLVLEELGLTDFVELNQTHDTGLKKELSISKDSALIIEEESIDFKDMIFEWILPEDEEIKSMFISIIWWGSWGWCAPEWCWSGCSC